MRLPTNAPSLKSKRKVLRKNQTYAEFLLWSKLRVKQLSGLKFYRQFSIGSYILDFYCVKKKLAVELDGGQHTEVYQKRYDVRRTQFLNEQGIKVIRFWDNEVIKNLDGVLEAVKLAANQINSP